MFITTEQEEDCGAFKNSQFYLVLRDIHQSFLVATCKAVLGTVW